MYKECKHSPLSHIDVRNCFKTLRLDCLSIATTELDLTTHAEASERMFEPLQITLGGGDEIYLVTDILLYILNCVQQNKLIYKVLKQPDCE